MTRNDGRSLDICDILNNDGLLFHLMEFIDNSEDRNHRSMLDFWMCANDFRRRAKTSTNANVETMSNDFRRRPITSTTSNANVETMSNEVSTLLQNDAIIIYDKFISLQASSPLGFGSDIRLNLKLIFFVLFIFTKINQTI